MEKEYKNLPNKEILDSMQSLMQEFNKTKSNVIPINNYNMISKSTKKDLSDIHMKTINTGYKNKCEAIICFNKSSKPIIKYDVKNEKVSIETTEGELYMHKESCDSYRYIYMGLAFFVSRSRQIYARQGKWREEKYTGCFNRDINAISSEILSLPATIYLQNMK